MGAETAEDVFTGYLRARRIPEADVTGMLDDAQPLLDDMTGTDGQVDSGRVEALAKRYRHNARSSQVQAELDRRFGKDRQRQQQPGQVGQQRDSGGRFRRKSTGAAEAARRFAERGGG